MEKQTKNAIEFKNINMVFSKIKALDDVSIKIKKGFIHAIVGENGAGKSTLMSILFGLYKPTSGNIKIYDIMREIKNPNYATKLGIGMVHQHFKIVDIYKNIDNIILGNETSYMGFLSRKESIKKIKNIQKEFNLKFNLNNKTGKETVGVKQKVEIIKMLYTDAHILVFDEPTAVLTPQEINGLLETIKDFKKNGKTIIFISHKLNEVKAIADEATILRKGKVIGNINVKKTSIKKMAEMIVGKKIVNIKNNFNILKTKKPLLKLEKVNAKILDKQIVDLSLDVFGGEIHSIAGVEGNGQRILEEVISGLKKPKSGKIFILDKKQEFINITHSSVKFRINNGISYIPSDRRKYALFLDFKISDNMISKTINKKDFSCFTFIKNKSKYNFYQDIQKKFDIRGGNEGDAIARSLSGGNQQKTVIGREMSNKHDILIVVQPTRGLDIGAINNIHKKILEEKKKGKAILLISFELDEVLALSDRISVISKGKILGTVLAKQTSRNEIGLLMAGIMKEEQKNA